MTTFTEGRHPAEFVLSEAGGELSRENGTAGETLKVGDVVKITANKLMVYDGSGTVVGIALYAAVEDDKIAYFARLGEVNGNMLTSAEATDGLLDAGAIAGLAALHIIIR